MTIIEAALSKIDEMTNGALPFETLVFLGEILDREFEAGLIDTVEEALDTLVDEFTKLGIVFP